MSPELWVALAVGVGGPISVVAVALINRRTHKAVEQVKEQIKTNHGSTSTGNAIDRITEVVWDIQRTVGAIQPVVMQDSVRLGQVETALSAQAASFADHEEEAEARDRILAEHARLLETHHGLVEQRLAPTLERVTEVLGEVARDGEADEQS